MSTSADTAHRKNASDSEDADPGPGGFIILFFIIGLSAAWIGGWVIFPKVLYSKKEQPVQFNHLIHNPLVKNGCESCHFFREDGSFAGVAKLAQCVSGCHEEVQGIDPQEAVFVNEYVAKNREVPWLIYARQPDNVFFSHAAHVKLAKMECVTCHGYIEQSESLKTYEENRVTGYSRDIWGRNLSGLALNSWDRMKMDDCARCHAEKTARKSSVQTEKEACFVCHK
ncbi:MAG: menaquinone reductase multiheme cytochrome c subunit QrcA [Desulfobacterales bacterium]|nr:menaquinone reductase multiheme cytochrome c subunit QrcA [Desulfobacterales bacterium]